MWWPFNCASPHPSRYFRSIDGRKSSGYLRSCGKLVTETNKNDKKEKNEKEILFNEFWKLYDKSVDKKKCMDKWMKLSDKEITSIFEHLPNYIKYTPDKTYRKNPVTYLNGKCWNDEEYTKPITYTNGERLDEHGFIYDPLVENMRKKGLI